jgi:2-oxoisovalerate dehydrogenase E1 component
MFAELMGKDQGTNRGRGGSMHIADPKLGIFGANGIVAAGLPIAVGAATAAQLRADGSVAVAFFGDGAAAQGAFHEALNLAAVWKLPVIFFCENNGYAEFSPASTQHAASLEQRAAGYGIPYVAVDGNDVVATAARDGERGGRRPGRVRTPSSRRPPTAGTATTRATPSATGRPEELTAMGGPRPAARARGAAPGSRRRRRRDQGARGLGGRRARRRRRGRPPAGESGGGHVDRLRRAGPTGASPSRPARADAPVFRTMDAIRPPSRPSSPRTSGCSWPASMSAPAATSSGSPADWPISSADRVRDTPISETAIIGLGVGAAMAGMRPVVELMYLDFLGVCFDQLLNQAAKLPFMTGGAPRWR